MGLLRSFIGNDIIDWQYARTQQHKLSPRCLKKLYNPNEIDFITNHNNPLLAFWVLWAAKESAYKAWQSEYDCKPIFNPKSFTCTSIKLNLIQIQNSYFECFVNTIITEDYIYSQCKSLNQNYEIFSSKVEFSLWLNTIFRKGWTIEKCKNGIPYLNHKELIKNIPISISHDNGFYAISWFDHIMIV
jgi:phosphopantetheinyl transferase (holo-ACP synthase)